MESTNQVVAQPELVIFTPVHSDSDQLNNEPSAISNDGVVIARLVHSLPEENKAAGKNLELYLCEKCNRTFKQKSRYDRHVANHPSEKHYLCDTCQKTFTRMSHLEKHMRTHTEERRHVCEHCGAAFILSHHLVRHMLIHTGVKPFECDICQKQFTRKAGLTQHQNVHTGERPFICSDETCGKQFTDRTTLRRHMLTHSREKPFICKECEKTFRTKSACRKHYLRHFKGGEAFKCGVCEEMFKSAELLKEHNIIHEQKQKVGVFRCGFCLRVFKSQTDLDSHVPLHVTGMTHSCSQCNAKFYTAADLDNHLATHQVFEKQVAEGSVYNNSPLNTPSVAASNKVVVVVQLPVSENDDNKVDVSGMDNIQEFLGSAQIDKLLVTTDKLSNNSSAVSLHLSEDQQQSIQNILQTTSLNQVNVKGPNGNSSVSTGVSLTSSSLSVTAPKSSNEMMNAAYIIGNKDDPKQEDSYILVPSFKEDQSFSVNFNVSNESPKKLDDSVFKSRKNYSDGLISSKINDATVIEKNKTEKTDFLDSDRSIIKAYQLYDTPPKNVVSTIGSRTTDNVSPDTPDDMSAIEPRSIESIDMHGPPREENKTPALFSEDFGNPLCDSNMLQGEIV